MCLDNNFQENSIKKVELICSVIEYHQYSFL